MSERLPVLSGAQLIDALGKLGWVVVRQRGTKSAPLKLRPRFRGSVYPGK